MAYLLRVRREDTGAHIDRSASYASAFPNVFLPPRERTAALPSRWLSVRACGYVR